MPPFSFRKLPDGSFVNAAGEVLYFSVDRFARDICVGGDCFICGKSRRRVPFNDEHILPDWILRRFNLHSRFITLPNLSSFLYGQYTIPCCEKCNSTLGKVIESPISKLVADGFEAVAEHLRSNGPWLFFTWFALIFLKTHLKDRTLRMNLDRRSEPAQIGDLYEWADLHHIHGIARSFYSRPAIEPEVLGSLLVLPAKTAAHYEAFDYGDLYLAQSVLLRIDDICFIVVLNDSNAVLSALLEGLNGISGPLSPIQLREIFVRFAYANLRLKNRPRFASALDEEKGFRIVARRSSSIEFEPGNAADYGKMLYSATKPILDHMHNPDIDQIKQRVREGNMTFLFDDKGKFIKSSMFPLP